MAHQSTETYKKLEGAVNEISKMIDSVQDCLVTSESDLNITRERLHHVVDEVIPKLRGIETIIGDLEKERKSAKTLAAEIAEKEQRTSQILAGLQALSNTEISAASEVEALEKELEEEKKRSQELQQKYEAEVVARIEAEEKLNTIQKEQDRSRSDLFEPDTPMPTIEHERPLSVSPSSSRPAKRVFTGLNTISIVPPQFVAPTLSRNTASIATVMNEAGPSALQQLRSTPLRDLLPGLDQDASSRQLEDRIDMLHLQPIDDILDQFVWPDNAAQAQDGRDMLQRYLSKLTSEERAKCWKDLLDRGAKWCVRNKLGKFSGVHKNGFYRRVSCGTRTAHACWYNTGSGDLQKPYKANYRD